MKKYVALLRGINVGGNKKVEMKKLRIAFESVGFSDVSTYINSGNVIFETSEKKELLPKKIEKTLKESFDLTIGVVIRDAESIRALVKHIPRDWQNDSKQKTDVLFLRDEFDKKSSLALITTNKEVDRVRYISGAIIWNMDREYYGKSRMRTFIGTPLYKNMTARNINTVRKLAELLGE